MGGRRVRSDLIIARKTRAACDGTILAGRTHYSNIDADVYVGVGGRMTNEASGSGLSWDGLLELAEESGREALDILLPYLPALFRAGAGTFNKFVAHLEAGELDEINAMMWDKMTRDEQQMLDQQIYSSGYQAALSKHRNTELMRKVLVKVAIRIAMKVATGGIA
jgi:hypothetical protein